MVVVDASAVVDVLLNRPVGERVRKRLFRTGIKFVAPHLIDLEVASALRSYVALGFITAERAGAAIDVFQITPIERYSHELLLRRVWSLRSNLTAYDAAYVALAELLGVPLVTTDKRLAKAAPNVAELIQ